MTYTAADPDKDGVASGLADVELWVKAPGASSYVLYDTDLTPNGTLVITGNEGARWTGMGRQLCALALSPLVRQRLTTFISGHRQADLEELRRLIESGRLTPVVGRTYPLAEAPQAIRHLQTGQARGKLAITVDPAG